MKETAMQILMILAGSFALLAIVVLAVPALRRALLTRPIFSAYRKVLPQMSDTEREEAMLRISASSRKLPTTSTSPLPT